jgi:hypothetical protein
MVHSPENINHNEDLDNKDRGNIDEPLDPDSEEARNLADLYKVEKQTDNVSDTESNKETEAEIMKLKELREVLKDEQEFTKGELEIAMAIGESEQILLVYRKLIETRLKSSQTELDILTLDFESGDFQGRMTDQESLLSGQELQKKIEEIYQYQAGLIETEISSLQRKLHILDQPIPSSFIETIAAEEDLEAEFEDNAANVIRRVLEEADKIAGWENESVPGSYGNFTKKLEGSMRAALSLQNTKPNPELVRLLRTAADKFAGKLPSDLSEEIASLEG